MGIGGFDESNPRRFGGLLAAALALSLGLVACTGGSASPNSNTTSTAGSTASLSTTLASSSASESTPTASLTPTTPNPTSSTTLGGDCATVLPVLAVDRLVGKTVPGRTELVVNLPDHTIGQVERISCLYGLLLPKGKTTYAAPLVEAIVSLYDTTAHANARVAATKETWREHGATPHAVTVAGHPAVVLTGFGSPLLVLGAGARTVALSMSATLVPAARRDAVMVSLAASALHGAGG
jgi:hypothetical protein